MPYDPKPIDNSRIELSAELKQLVERLAANNHDLWASRRISEGWKYGPRRDDEETLGLLARTYKDLWLTTGSSKDLGQAYESYAKAFNLKPDRYWTGINAATLAFIKGDGKTARELAGRIHNICNDIMKQEAA